jgi:lysophospholipase L1-like esterase
MDAMTIRTLTKVVAAVAVAVAAVAPTTACVARPMTTPPPITLAVAGDSLSEAPASWLHQLDDPGIQYVGGYQHSGYTAGEVLTNYTRVPCDVLVVMLGTNDVKAGIPTATTVANIEAITRRGGALHVLLTSLPPSDYPDWSANHFNLQSGNYVDSQAVSALAVKHGWTYVDPFSEWRTYTNGYADGATLDGIHPTAAVDAVIADRMALYIHQAFLAANGWWR